MGSPVLVGTVTLDVLHEGPIGAGRAPVTLRWGGVMNNTACALGMRGADPALVTVTYSGELAPSVAAHLADNLVRWVPLSVSWPLPLFHAQLDGGSVTHKMFLGGEALSALTPAVLESHRVVFDDARVVVAGTDSEEPTLVWLAGAAAARGLPFWLLSADPTEVAKLRPGGHPADLVALNLPELSGWAGRALTDRADIVDAARELAAPGGRCLVTLGAAGALLVRAGSAEVVYQPAPAIGNPRLAVGAGDVLFGCLLAAHLCAVDWVGALRQASTLTGTFLRDVATARAPFHVLRSPDLADRAGLTDLADRAGLTDLAGRDDLADPHGTPAGLRDLVAAPDPAPPRSADHASRT